MAYERRWSEHAPPCASGLVWCDPDVPLELEPEDSDEARNVSPPRPVATWTTHEKWFAQGDLALYPVVQITITLPALTETGSKLTAVYCMPVCVC